MFATVIVALVFLPLFMLGSVEGRLLRPLGFGLCRRAGRIARRRPNGHAGAVLVAPAELAPDRVGNGAAVRRGDSRPRTNAGWPRVHILATVLATAVAAAGRGAGWHRGGGPIVPSGVQRRRLDGQCGDYSPARAWRTPTRSAMPWNGPVERAGGDIDGPANRPRGTRRTRARCGVGGDRRAPRDEGSAARSGPRGASTESLAAPGHQRHDRPADLASHRSHAVGHASQHRDQDLRRRSADPSAAGDPGAGADVTGGRSGGPLHRGAD